MTAARSRVLVRAAAVGTLLAALLLGGVIGRRIGVGSTAPRMRTPGVVGLPMTRDSLIGVLGLDAAQRPRVEAILAEGAARSDSIMRTLLEQVRGITDATREQLIEVLRPDQRVVLDSLLRAQPPMGVRRPR